MCQVALRLKEVQMGTHDFKYNKVPLFLLENQGISILTSMFAAPKLALVPAYRYMLPGHTTMYGPSFIKI